MPTYIETVGRRKTATARVRITEAAKQSIVVNGKPLETYFVSKQLSNNVLAPLKEAGKAFTITVVVRGGGIAGQSDAVRHGLARAITKFDSSKRTALKKLGFLKRDPRAKERRKPGLVKARKAPQWSKR